MQKLDDATAHMTFFEAAALSKTLILLTLNDEAIFGILASMHRHHNKLAVLRLVGRRQGFDRKCQNPIFTLRYEG